MTRRYTISGAVTNGEYASEDMSADYSYAELSSIEFFDVAGARVTPSAGTYGLQGLKTFPNDTDETWRSVANSAGDVIHNAANAYDVDAAMPAGYNLMTRAKITLAGITGATTFRAVVWRS